VVALPRRRAARSGGRFLAAVLSVGPVLAVAPTRADAATELLPVSLEKLRDRIEGRASTTLTGRGLEIQVSGRALVALPFPAQELELDAEADGPILLSWASLFGRRYRLYGPPWRYATLPRVPATVPLDLRIARSWTPSVKSVLVLKGTGTVVVHAMRQRPVPEDLGDALLAHDRALLWAPESIGHTTINFLTPSHWSASRVTWLSDVVAGVAFAAFLAVLAVLLHRRRRLRPGLALAVAGLVALAAWDAHFLVRFLPMANLRFDPDPEARIRENYYFNPEFGELAALARATLRPDERVGTMGAPKDWFGPQTLCLNLAPRPCVIVKRGEAVHAGISGVGTLRLDELDAIVSFHGGPLSDGFVPVAAVNPQAVVARRR